ncbi:hypothetical protein PUN28_017968 [Cardiocondyla obscurior]|uniref:Uncharacterized protein n=1 Tax=Cardiocondyla obscurior TaxID=286306 RepID=A0AAW2EJF9_9HYME
MADYDQRPRRLSPDFCATDRLHEVRQKLILRLSEADPRSMDN